MANDCSCATKLGALIAKATTAPHSFTKGTLDRI